MKEEPNIRVMLLENVQKVSFSPEGKAKVIIGKGYTNANPGDLWEVTYGNKLEITVNSSLKIENPKFPIILIPEEKHIVKINHNPYRGKLLILPANKGLKVINIVPMEEYLFGVVPAEIGKVTPDIYEAAKAQAVAARSYAFSKFGKRKNFDVYSCVKDQIYEGVRVETPLARKAVLETRGEVMVCGDEIVEAKYHSTCGGKTAEAQEIWEIEKKYLRSIKDTPHRWSKSYFCKNSPHFSWEVMLMEKDFYEKLGKAIPDAKMVNKWRLNKSRKSGRVKWMELYTDKGKSKIKGTTLRNIFNLKSTYFDIKKRHNQILIEGHGWGHGVGMCQWGAFGMARKGYNYKKILRHYYKHTRIVKLY